MGTLCKEGQEWGIKECLRRVVVKHGGPAVLVINNAPRHSDTGVVLEKDMFKEHEILGWDHTFGAQSNRECMVNN